MNSSKRNYLKKQIEEIKLTNVKLFSGMILWGLIGIATLPTIIGPYLCYGYIKKYMIERESNLERIRKIEEEIKSS